MIQQSRCFPQNAANKQGINCIRAVSISVESNFAFALVLLYYAL